MDIRFSMTPRLLVLAGACALALLVLMFSLGYLLGQQLRSPAAALDGAVSIPQLPQVSLPAAAGATGGESAR